MDSLQNLSPEQMSLAFQLLYRESPVTSLPQELESLSLENWHELSLLLKALMLEKRMSSLH